MAESTLEKVRRLDDYRWELPQDYKPGMRVPGIIYADREMMEAIHLDQALDQVANVAFLPGIVEASFAMPDIHWGYGFPIGGIAATRVADGVVSPGGVGFDINCGVRLLRTRLTEEDVRPKLEELVTALFREVPSGVGSSGKINLKGGEIDQVLRNGARWAVEHGFGEPEDLVFTEEEGRIPGADPARVGSKAKKRGTPQLGTLGSGNHFLEVAVVDEVYDADAARAFGLDQIGQVVVWIHCGSRGLGHQVCQDSLQVMDASVKTYGIELPDRQLACAPVTSPEGQDYLAALRCAANFAWANRQCIAHWVRESFLQVFDRSKEDLGIEQVYDIAHNIAKIETHMVNGLETEVCVHRKGSTRAFPPGHPEIPEAYRSVGQPVLIPGDMGRYSFVAVGTSQAMEETFGSTCHGAGRQKSRGAARRLMEGVDVAQMLLDKGIVVKARSKRGLAEEAPEAYKDAAKVVDVAHRAGISTRVVRTRPMGVVKG
ncbi:MAG: RtcB family protein [Chloroflexi bacterium]|nr:RtcB family protein [Chloroflexota bacterium]